MFDYLQLVMSRIMRNDAPKRCNAMFYKVSNDTSCDCKIWCKYPPPGKPSRLSVKVIS